MMWVRRVTVRMVMVAVASLAVVVGAVTPLSAQDADSDPPAEPGLVFPDVSDMTEAEAELSGGDVLIVQTSPPLPGAVVSVDDRTARAGADGVAYLVVFDENDLGERIVADPPDDTFVVLTQADVAEVADGRYEVTFDTPMRLLAAGQTDDTPAESEVESGGESAGEAGDAGADGAPAPEAGSAAILFPDVSNLVVAEAAFRDGHVVTISTIPPLPNIQFTVDERTLRTDANGEVSIVALDRDGVAQRIEVQPLEQEMFRAEHARTHRIDRDHYKLAFDIFRPVSFSFHGTNEEIISIEQIESVNLKNSLGGILEDVPLDEPLWLYSNRVVSTQRGPEVRDIEWSIESVFVRETNVVNRAQVRFFPRVQPGVDVPLLFFKADFSVHDMFFGWAQGNAINLEYPDGEIIRHELDENGRLVLDSLPRGEYHVIVEGSGPNISRPVVLSRNQDVDLEFLSWLDIGVVGILGAFFLLAPVLIGRRWFRRRRNRPDDSPGPSGHHGGGPGLGAEIDLRDVRSPEPVS